MMSSTSMTSMNGVTLISCASENSSSFSMSAMEPATSLLRRARHHAGARAIEIARHEPRHRARSSPDEIEIAARGAREMIVDDHGRDRSDESDRRRQQGFGDTRRDDGKVRRLRFRNADKAVHNAPHGAEQADEWRGGADRRKRAHPEAYAARLRARDLSKRCRGALFHAGRIAEHAARELHLFRSRRDEIGEDGFLTLEQRMRLRQTRRRLDASKRRAQPATRHE